MNNKITCFVSYSNDKNNINKINSIKKLVENSEYCIDYSEKVDKREYSDETIWKYLHDRIAGSSCTILLLTYDILTYNNRKIKPCIGSFINSGWIYNEISASLRDWKDNRINGIVCVIDDSIFSKIKIKNNQSFNSFYYPSYQYELPEILKINKEYIIFVKYSDFISNHHYFLNEALKNRNEQIQSNGNAFKINYELHKRQYNY